MKDKLLVLVLTAVLLLGGLIHASFSHSHGTHSHGEGDSMIWSQLHGSLRHEDKKPLAALFEDAVLSFYAFVVAAAGSLLTLRVTHDTASRRDPSATDSLRRGIERYRVFG